MSKPLDVKAVARAMEGIPGLLFALLFGSARGGVLPRAESDVDVAVYLDHEPGVDERGQLLGLLQDVVQSDRVDLVFLNVTESPTVQREALFGQLLVCRDPERYAAFFSLADRRGRDERDRIARAWAMRRALRSA